MFQDYTSYAYNDGLVFDYSGDNSAIKKFFETIQTLNNSGHDLAGMVTFASNHFRNISEALQPANSNLAGGWKEAADLVKKIDEKMQEQLRSLINEMNLYAESSSSGELEAQNAVDESNAVTNSLLNELNSF